MKRDYIEIPSSFIKSVSKTTEIFYDTNFHNARSNRAHMTGQRENSVGIPPKSQLFFIMKFILRGNIYFSFESNFYDIIN